MKIIIRYMVILSIAFGLFPSDWAVKANAMKFDMSAFIRINEETENFLGAKEHVFTRAWSRAKEKLEQYLNDYPTGRYRDEALYWMAKSLNALASNEKSERKVNSLLEEAVDRLGIVIAEYPNSLWFDDAQELKIELSAQLALMGHEISKEFIRDFVRTKIDPRTRFMEELEDRIWDQAQYSLELGVLGLNALMGLEPQSALPVIDRLLKEEQNSDIRKRAVFILGSHFGEDGFELLQRAHAEDPDEEVRREADYWVEQVKLDRIPTHFDAYGFNARIRDIDNAVKFENGEALSMQIPTLLFTNSNRIGKYLKRFYNAYGLKLDRIELRTATLGGYRSRHSLKLYHSLNRIAEMIPVSERAKLQFDREVAAFPLNGFSIADFDKGYDQITGRIEWRDPESQNVMMASYWIDLTKDFLMAVRDGNELRIALLKFRTVEKLPKIAGEPKYNITFSDILGCKLQSMRETWSVVEFSGSDNVIDYGRARAEIPGESGRWILTGHILVDRKQNRFIARSALLYDPKGNIKAEGTEIIVPASMPEQFRIIAGRNDRPIQ